MTLKKQLWLGIGILMGIAFIGSFALSSKTSQAYLLEQLQQKNIDTVNSLALSLSHSGADEVSLELLIAAQFDTGHYRYIRLFNHNGELIVNKSIKQSKPNIPLFLPKLFPIEPDPGLAHISNGWQQTGTLELQSHNQFAYRALWEKMIDLSIYFFSAAILCGLIGNWLLGHISRPLTQVVAQANALGERRFIITKEPSTLEFKTLTRAMNSLTERVKLMLEEESLRLQQVQKQNLHDELTGLLNRQSFIDALHATLNRDDSHSSGIITLVRLKDLSALNRRYSRAVIDKLLKSFAHQLSRWNIKGDAVLGRLNGSDFAITCNSDDNPQTLAEVIRTLFLEQSHHLSIETSISAAAGRYSPSDNSSSLLSRIDAALANAEELDEGGIVCVEATVLENKREDDWAYWQTQLAQGLDNLELELAQYPTLDPNGQLLHWEAPCRVLHQHQRLTAGQYLPWLHRFEQIEHFDLAVVKITLNSLATHARPLAINLNPQTLANTHILAQIIAEIDHHPELSQWLWLEFSETGLYQYLENFKHFCRSLKTSGCKLGIEHVGHHIDRIGQLHDLGVDYLKVDVSLIRDCSDNRDKQIVLQGLRGIAHSLGVQIIAEGIETQADWHELIRLGFDGGTGPWIQYSE